MGFRGQCEDVSEGHEVRQAIKTRSGGFALERVFVCRGFNDFSFCVFIRGLTAIQEKFAAARLPKTRVPTVKGELDHDEKNDSGRS